MELVSEKPKNKSKLREYIDEKCRFDDSILFRYESKIALALLRNAIGLRGKLSLSYLEALNYVKIWWMYHV